MAEVDLAYDVAGAGPPLILVHGIAENRHSWDPVPLHEHFRVVRVDLRGHGESPGREPYDLPTLARDVHAVAEKVAPGEPPVVVGHSIGGVVVSVYAGLFPVRAAVNVDQVLALAEMRDQVLQAEPMLRGDGLDAFVGAMFGQLSGALDPAEAARLAALRRPNREAILGMWAPLLELTAVELDALVRQHVTVPAGTPYLALHGLDPGPQYAAWLAGLIPGATVEIWGEVPTHFPHLVDPARFVARVRDFVATA